MLGFQSRCAHHIQDDGFFVHQLAPILLRKLRVDPGKYHDKIRLGHMNYLCGIVYLIIFLALQSEILFTSLSFYFIAVYILFYITW